MNLANKITILRIVLIPVFITMIIYDKKWMALFVFFVSALSDAVDGFIARSMGQRTKLGTILDPLADKLLLTSSFVAVVILHFIPIWLAVIVISRDIILIIGAVIIHMLVGELKIVPTILGKCTTFLQLCTVFISMTLSYYPAYQNHNTILLNILIWVTAIVTILSGIQYIYRGSKLFNNGRE